MTLNKQYILSYHSNLDNLNNLNKLKKILNLNNTLFIDVIIILIGILKMKTVVIKLTSLRHITGIQPSKIFCLNPFLADFNLNVILL